MGSDVRPPGERERELSGRMRLAYQTSVVELAARLVERVAVGGPERPLGKDKGREKSDEDATRRQRHGRRY